MYTAVQVWALAEVHGTCSGGSKSRKLTSNHGDAFRALKSHPGACKPTRIKTCYSHCVRQVSHMPFCGRVAPIAWPPRAHAGVLAPVLECSSVGECSDARA